MKVLVIPDIHLKPYMFDSAKTLLENNLAHKAVCLGDLADDWGRQWDKELYIETYDRAIKFAKDFPGTLWCYGNHDVAYPWNQKQSGYSPIAAYIVTNKLQELKETMPDNKQLAFIHRIDDVMFMHGGLSDYYVRKMVPAKAYNNIDMVIETINGFGYSELWTDISPLWLRPQYNNTKMYKPRKMLQVVGHTPVSRISKVNNIISCDSFSTDREHCPIGPWEFVIVDTKTKEYWTEPFMHDANGFTQEEAAELKRRMEDVTKGNVLKRS